jgi:predicted DNA binding CopG/RHH family protein
MTNTPEFDDTELWENRELGASEEYVRRVSKDRQRAFDDALGLQPITIRLQKELVDELKELAKSEGLGYQPYVRQILTCFVREKQEKRKLT